MSPAAKKTPPPPPPAENTVVEGIETEGWMPEPGDELTGTVTTIGAGYSEFRAKFGNGTYPILTIAATQERNLTNPEEITTHDPPKDIAVHAFQAVLFNELTTQRPMVGEVVTITFGGKRRHKTIASQTVAVYKVRVHREGTDAASWDDLFGPPPGRAQVTMDKATGEVLPEPEEIDHPF